MPWTYRPELDGLRSFAVYLVLLFHAGLADVRGGFIGVDLFFVLSGFLVSNVILSEIDATGRLELGKFYARRIRRLLPAALVVVVATCLVFVLVTPLVQRLPLVRDAQSALLYVANWNFLRKQQDYFATDVQESPFLHFWSLAIEEQFYFVYPVVLLLLALAARRRRWVLPVGVGALFAVSFAAQVFWAQVNQSWAYYGTDARLYQLMAGALLAVALRMWFRPVPVGVASAGAMAGLASMLLLGSGLLDLSPSDRGIAATIASVMLVGGLMLAETGPLARLLSRRTPVYLGQISYGTYLWHWPVILVLRELLTVRPFTLAVLAVGLSTALAALSYQLLETPIRSAPGLHPFRWRTVLVGISASALVAVTVVPIVLDSERRPRLAAAAASASLVTFSDSRQVTVEERNAPVPRDLDWKRITARTPLPPTCTSEEPRACVLVEGKGPHVLLVGDSHALSLTAAFKKLAEEKDLTLSVNVLEGCPWQAGLVDRRLSRAANERCLAHRERWYKSMLPQLRPDIVVLSQMGRDNEKRWQRRLARENGSDEKLPELLFNTTQETARLITRQGARALILNTLPALEKNPAECLARAQRLHQCEFSLPRASLSDAYNRTTASLMDDVYAVDIARAFCAGEPRCLPIVDGVVVWHDAHHFTPDIGVRVRDQIWTRIERSGVLEGLWPRRP